MGARQGKKKDSKMDGIPMGMNIGASPHNDQLGHVMPQQSFGNQMPGTCFPGAMSTPQHCIHSMCALSQPPTLFHPSPMMSPAQSFPAGAPGLMGTHHNHQTGSIYGPSSIMGQSPAQGPCIDMARTPNMNNRRYMMDCQRQNGCNPPHNPACMNYGAMPHHVMPMPTHL